MLGSSSVHNVELELWDVLEPQGKLPLGFLDAGEPDQGAMVSAQQEVLPKEVVPELLEEHYDGQQFAPGLAVVPLLTV